jgi:hypothetical protein
MDLYEEQICAIQFCVRFCKTGRVRTHHERNTKALLDASRAVGLEVNSEKTKYVFTSRHQITGRNHNIKGDIKGLSKHHAMKTYRGVEV